MKRNELVNKLIKEGFSTKTLVCFSDKQLLTLLETIDETTVIIPKDAPDFQKQKTDAMNSKKTIETYEEVTEDEDPCWDGYKQLGMKKKGGKQVPNCVKEEETGEKKERGWGRYKKNSKLRNKNREISETKNWLSNLIESQYHSVTTKNEIMELITSKLTEQETMIAMPKKAKKGHNGIPEFMTYDSIVSDSPAPTKEPTTKPGVKPTERPKTPNPFRPNPGKEKTPDIERNPAPKAKGKGLPIKGAFSLNEKKSK